jgi:hypothetical protein
MNIAKMQSAGVPVVPVVSPHHRLFIRRASRIADAAAIYASVCGNRLQSYLVPLPLDRRASGYSENEKRFARAQDRSNEPLLPTISSCVLGPKRHVVCTTMQFRDTAKPSCSSSTPQTCLLSIRITEAV